MTTRSDAERMRGVFAEAAYGITPSPLPLAAIERAGRARKRRRAAGLAVCCGLLLAPLAAAASHLSAADHPRSQVAPAVSATPTVVPSAVRVVAPGEKVQAVPGVTMWLAADGKHWSTPDQGDQFRSVVDGNMVPGGVSAQQEGVNGRLFLSGVFMGRGEAARVEVVTQGGTLSGHVLTLAGHPGWGAWYADGGPSRPQHVVDPQHPFHSDVRKVTVYDTAGKVVAQLVVPDRA